MNETETVQATDTAQKSVPRREFMSYCTAATGQGMVFGIMSSYMSDFHVNVLRVNPLFTFFLTLITRVMDAVTDPIMGMIVDRGNLKGGKMLPFVRYSWPFIAVLTFFLFFAPAGITGTQAMIYATITFVLWSIAYTITDVPFWALPNLMTPNPEERSSLLSLATVTNGVGGAVPMALFMGLGFILPLMTDQDGVAFERTRFIIIAAVAATLGVGLYLNAMRAKERIKLPPVQRKRQPGQAGTFKQIIRCKPLLLIILMGILSAGRYLFNAGAVHVARYSFYIGQNLEGLSATERRDALHASISTVSLVYAVSVAAGMFITMIVVTQLMKRFNYKQILIASGLFGAVVCLIIFALGYESFWRLVPLLVLTGVPLGAINVLIYPMVGDALDYMEWTTGVRQSALGQACATFTQKFGNAIATASIVLMYIIVDLDLSTIGIEYTADMTALSTTVRGGMFSLVSIIPAVSLVLCVIPIFFYDLTGKKKDRITAELAQQRAEKGIAIE